MNTLKDMFIKDESFYQRKKQSVDELMANAKIAALLNHYHLDRAFVESNWIDFLNYAEDLNHCEKCTGIEQCQKNFPGYRREMTIEGGHPAITLKVCDYGQALEEQRRVYSHITTNLPKEMLLTSFKEVDLNNQGNIVSLVRTLMDDAKQRPQKGLYVHGDMGIGKTYVMGAFCNLLAVHLKTCAFISMPQLLQDLKGYFNSDEDNGLNHLKEVEYLVLDDLGAETLSTWGRDEILYNLLNERMLRKLPTYFTSVYDLKDLENHYLINKSRDEMIKVKRLIDRISALSNDFELMGRRFR